MLATMNDQFIITPWLLLVPLVVILLVVLKVPTTAISVGIVLDFLPKYLYRVVV